MTNKNIARCAFLCTLAIIIGYIESLIPLNFAIPGIKLGLSNIVILFALYRLNTKYAFTIMLLKVFCTALLFSGMSALWYSLAGGLFSFFIMLILKKTELVSVCTVSISGGVFHNIGQLTAASAVLKTLSVFWYLPILVISGIVTGFFSGVLCNMLFKYVKGDV